MLCLPTHRVRLQSLWQHGSAACQGCPLPAFRFNTKEALKWEGRRVAKLIKTAQVGLWGAIGFSECGSPCFIIPAFHPMSCPEVGTSPPDLDLLLTQTKLFFSIASPSSPVLITALQIYPLV